MTAVLVLMFLGGVMVGAFANEARWMRAMDRAMRDSGAPLQGVK